MLAAIMLIVITIIGLLIGRLLYYPYFSRFLGLQILIFLGFMSIGFEIGLLFYTVVLEPLMIFPLPWNIPTILQIAYDLQDGNFCLAVILSIAIGLAIYAYYVARVFFHVGKPLGKAHFAGGLTLHRAGLFAEEGFVIGDSLYGTLHHRGFEPLLVVAGTGGGKTRSLVIPNVFALKNDTLIITDIKGEVYQKTKQYRRQLGNEILRFEPASNTTHRYNPLSQVRLDHIDEDLDGIFKVLIPDSNDPLWADGSRHIAKMMALYYLLEKQKTPTFQMIYQDICSPTFSDNIQILQQKVNTTRIKTLFSKFLATRDQVRQDLLLNAQEYLSPFDSPRLAYATGENDIDFLSLRAKATTVYLIMPANTQTYGPIVAIFFEQLLQIITHQGEPKKHEYSITIMMDEFANFPKMPSLARGITFLRSYRIRVCAFIQHIAQLKDVYGDQGKESFLACPLQIAFNITSIDDARYFSALAGRETIQVTNESLSKDMAMSVSMNTQHRDLLRPEEVMQLSQKKMLIFKKGFGVINIKKNYSKHYRAWQSRQRS